ncbi:MAG TPA: pyridoxamine 5'-phosphate oxidase family protein, partial [Acidimicrobiales bacterium]|nr:pyridoxamine 5'-phosphate oxidase family protein [Acidimicrobiales bacterium]
TFEPNAGLVRRALARRSFATVATVSERGRPHVAGVLYALADDALWFSTDRDSRKGRNLAANPHVAVDVLVRRIPVGPPSSIHFQATAEIVDTDDPRLRALVAAGELKSITGHGELDRPGGCFVRVALPGRVHTYGLGMSLLHLARHPLECGGTTRLDG